MTSTVYELVQLASRAYREKSFCAPGDLEVLIEKKTTYNCVAICGTEIGKLISGAGVRDVIRDINVRPYYIEGYGYGPRGALRGAETILPLLLQQIDPCKPVKITGHSLGGWIACPLAYLLSKNGMLVSDCVTFGAPRAIARWSPRPELNYSITQYIYGDDPAPIWPWLRYKHLAVKCIKLSEHGHDFGFDHKIDNYEMALCS